MLIQARLVAQPWQILDMVVAEAITEALDNVVLERTKRMLPTHEGLSAWVAGGLEILLGGSGPELQLPSVHPRDDAGPKHGSAAEAQRDAEQ